MIKYSFLLHCLNKTAVVKLVHVVRVCLLTALLKVVQHNYMSKQRGIVVNITTCIQWNIGGRGVENGLNFIIHFSRVFRPTWEAFH